MSNRRVTLGPVTTSTMNVRAGLGHEVGGGPTKGSRRMSVGPTPRMSMGPGMGSMATMSMKEAVAAAPAPAAPVPASSMPVGARRMSMEAAPAARRASVGVSRLVWPP